MCWGFQPTLIFVSVEFLCLVALYVRNQRNDRLNAFMHVPLFSQEAIQLAIWAVIAREPGATPKSCEGLNVGLSFLEACVVGFLPGWLALYAYKGQPPGPSIYVLQRRLKSWVWACVCWVSLSVVLFVLTQALGWSPRCTVAGPMGHQIWPFVSIKPRFLVFLNVCVYDGLLCTSLAMTRHVTVVPAGLAAVGFLPVLLFAVMGDEWGSFWCFSASLLCVLYLIEPLILEHHFVDRAPRFGGLLPVASDAANEM